MEMLLFPKRYLSICRLQSLLFGCSVCIRIYIFLFFRLILEFQRQDQWTCSPLCWEHVPSIQKQIWCMNSRVLLLLLGSVSSPIFFSNLRISMWSENNWFPQFLAFFGIRNFGISYSDQNSIDSVQLNLFSLHFFSISIPFASTSLSNLLWLCKLNFSTDQIIHIKWKWVEQGICCFSVQLTFIVQAAEYY